MGLVVKSWAVDNAPVDELGNYVVIKCRQEGLISFVLSLVGIDPVTTLMAHPDRIEFIEASLNGVKRRIIRVSRSRRLSTAFTKPLKEILVFIAIVSDCKRNHG